MSSGMSPKRKPSQSPCLSMKPMVPSITRGCTAAATPNQWMMSSSSV